MMAPTGPINARFRRSVHARFDKEIPMNQADRAAYFRQLHNQPPLVLPNAWDGASARVIESAGALAIATTSAGVSWTFGRGDGQKLRRDEMMRAIRYIVETVAV